MATSSQFLVSRILGVCRAFDGSVLVNLSSRGDVEESVRLALTGSPGVGKTTISSFLSHEGLQVVSVESLAESRGCIDAKDPVDGARPIDVEELFSQLKRDWSNSPIVSTVIDGHLSHLLPVDCYIIVRCNPSVLRDRLEERGYTKEKVRQNLEWEIIGGAWNEVRSGYPVIELDATSGPIEDKVKQIMEWMTDGFKPDRPANPIDWIGKGEA